MDWNGLICVVTGASSGFGLEAAKEFARRGATLILVARREERLKAVIDDLGGDPHMYFVCDISSIDSVRKLAAEVASRVDHVDILINNAGVASSGPLEGATSEDLDQLIRTNLLGPMWCTKEFLDLIDRSPRRSRTPVIVNVASMAGRIPIPKSGDYNASKFGLVGFTEGIWSELNEKKIRTMMLLPGLADTEGFPMDEIRASPLFGWTVMDADRVVKALINGIERGSFEVRVQWWMHPLYHLTVAVGPLRRLISSNLRGMFGGVGRF